MGARNFLIDGRSGSGKTTVCDELLRRGHHAIHGDRVLAYLGDPETGEPVPDPDCDCPECLNWLHDRWIWNLELVRKLAADRQEPVTFFCGGTRNFAKISDLFDAVFVLHVDLDTLQQRLEQRPEDEFGGKQSDRDFVARVYPTSEGLPDQGIMINSGRPVTDVVDEILRHVNDASDRHRAESTDAEPRRGPAVHPADHPAGEQRVGEVDRRGSDPSREAARHAGDRRSGRDPVRDPRQW